MTPGEPINGLAMDALLDGRYRLIRRLGSGGMAMVWLAEDEQLGRRVAVKVPADILAGDEAYLRRFRREARIAARLSHPNLVTVYDFSDGDEGRPFLVMEYVEGDTLDDLRGARMDSERLARELLDALQHIHAAGIVHRDVKPSNVLMTGEGRARLTDFGIAQPEDATRITQTGQVMGSRGYMAPEILAGERATARSDLYSCGMVLGNHLEPTGSPALRELVARLTAPDPDARPRSAAEALAALERPESRTTRREAPTAPTLPHREARTGIRPAHAIGALLAVALAGLLILVSSDDGGPRPPGEATETDAATTSSNTPDPAAGARLNQEGYQLIQQGKPEEAVPTLRQAVAAFPEGTTDLNYAYALFNLGQALRLSGSPDEAIPILEERAKIDNQRATVLDELAKAREAAAE